MLNPLYIDSGGKKWKEPCVWQIWHHKHEVKLDVLSKNINSNALFYNYVLKIEEDAFWWPGLSPQMPQARIIRY